MSSDTSHPETVEGETSAALLAELDSLLERMLALPVNHLGEPPAQPERREVPVITVTEAMPEGIASQSPAPAVSAATDDLYRQAILHPPEEPEPEPIRLPEPVTIRREELAELETLPPLPDPPRLAPPARVPEPPPSEPVTRTVTPPRQILPAAPNREHGWLRPLVWCNAAFDRATRPLGTAGRWLRHPAGRAVLGWTGVLCLLAVGGLTLGDALGWTR